MILPLLYVIVLMAISILASNAFQNVVMFTPEVNLQWQYNNPPSSSLHMATWSNGQAIQEYKDFLATGVSLHMFLLCFGSTDMNI